MFGRHLLLLLSFSVCGVFSTVAKKLDLEQLRGLRSRAKTGVVEMNTVQFKSFSLVDHGDRNYHLFVLFNALDPSTKCPVCAHVGAGFQKMVQLFNRRAKTGSLPSFFAQIELKNNMEAFQLAGVDRVPMLLHFGPAARAPTAMSAGNPNEIPKILEFIAQQSGSQINVQEALLPEPNYNGLIATGLVVAVLGGLVVSGQLSLSSIWQNAWIWSTLVLGFIVVMMSGYMWTRIRKAPYVGSNTGVDVLYFATTLQSQLGVECRIVGAITLLAAGSFVLLPYVLARFDGANKQRVATLVMTGLCVAGHGALLRAFQQKFPGYPLKYLF